MSWAATNWCMRRGGRGRAVAQHGRHVHHGATGQLNPYMYSQLYGAGAAASTRKKVGVKNQAEIDAANAARAASGGGLMGQAEQLSQQPANPLQPQSAVIRELPLQPVQGYNAMNQAGAATVMGFQNPYQAACSGRTGAVARRRRRRWVRRRVRCRTSSRAARLTGRPPRSPSVTRSTHRRGQCGGRWSWRELAGRGDESHVGSRQVDDPYADGAGRGGRSNCKLPAQRRTGQPRRARRACTAVPDSRGAGAVEP